MENNYHAAGLDKPLPTGVSYDEWFERMKAIMEKLYGKQKAETPEQVSEMFVVYGMAFSPTMSNRGCSSCVTRVHQRMSHYYRKYVLDAPRVTQKKKRKNEVE